MKKNILLLLIAILLLALTGCSTAYPFPESAATIQKIEIVNINNDDCEIIKTLSNEEKDEFIAKLKQIQFTSVILGDPLTSINGICVKITYNKSYDIISYFWAHHYENSKQYSIRKCCDKDIFYNLIKEFAQLPMNTG